MDTIFTNSKNSKTSNFPHKLFVTNRKVANLCKAKLCYVSYVMLY